MLIERQTSDGIRWQSVQFGLRPIIRTHLPGTTAGELFYLEFQSNGGGGRKREVFLLI